MNKEKQISILKTAVKRFAKHGLNKTTLDEIARDMRLGKATLYHYFNSKEELFFAAIEFECASLLDQIKLIFANNEISFEEKIIEYYKLKRELLISHKLLFDILTSYYIDRVSEREKLMLSNLFEEELAIIKTYLQDNYIPKNENIIFELPNHFVMKSWFEILFPKINDLHTSNINVNNEILKRELDILLNNSKS